jgi:phosphoserine phosphatase RsbU/P
MMSRTLASPSIDYQDLFEKAPCGYVLADQDGRFLRVNQTFSDWFGYSEAAMLGRRLSDILTIAGKIFYETHFAPTLHMQGQLNEVALDFIADAGARISALVNATQYDDAQQGDVRVCYAIFRATERRDYERGLLDARNQAEAAVVSEKADSKSREQFIAVLGHDLRNPLASIASGVHMLEKESLSERGRKIITLMHGSVVRAAGLIDNVLDFARGRLGGGMTLTLSPDQPLEPVLRQVVAELRSISPEQEIEAHYALDAPVRCDHVRIGQLLSNLLGNALTHGAKDKPIHVDASTSHGDLVIAVSNAGDPIPSASLERLFQPFFRGHDRMTQGLGLGLYIASEIARAHGGTLVARSDKVATTFVFTMPLIAGEDGNE